MTQQKNKRKPKRLRDVYNADPAAKAFLEAHPEFNDRFIEQVEVAHPGFNITDGRYRLTDVAPELKDYGSLMLEAVAALPADHIYKALLEAYYHENAPFAELQKRFNSKNRNALWAKICSAKKAALSNLTTVKRISVAGGAIPLATRSFTYKGVTKVVQLVWDGRSEDYVWVRAESGEPLPEYIQDILDHDPNVKEWDHLWL